MVMEIITGGWQGVLLYLMAVTVAVSSAGICWKLWRLADSSVRLLDRAADVSDELKGIDSRLTAMAKSLVSIEAVLERDPPSRRSSESSSDESRTRKKMYT
jgi:hypothetical protein